MITDILDKSSTWLTALSNSLVEQTICEIINCKCEIILLTAVATFAAMGWFNRKLFNFEKWMVRPKESIKMLALDFETLILQPYLK